MRFIYNQHCVFMIFSIIWSFYLYSINGHFSSVAYIFSLIFRSFYSHLFHSLFKFRHFSSLSTFPLTFQLTFWLQHPSQVSPPHELPYLPIIFSLLKSHWIPLQDQDSQTLAKVSQSSLIRVSSIVHSLASAIFSTQKLQISITFVRSSLQSVSLPSLAINREKGMK